MEKNLAGKIAPEIIERIKAIQEKLMGLLKKPIKPNVLKPTSLNNLLVRCNGYYREITRQYSRDEFEFGPGDIIIDKHNVMSICLGVAKSPDSTQGNVLWFLSETDTEPHYLSDNIPNQIQRDYALVLVA
jgi:hypothetical protein